VQVDAKANTKAFRGQRSLQSCKIIENTKGNQKEAMAYKVWVELFEVVHNPIHTFPLLI
jgi:hypothetical protein